MEKTASEWFDMLIEPYCSQAKENAIYHGVYKDLHTAICAEFSWELTPSETQGDRYWRTVYKSILNKETTYLKPTEPAQPQFGEWVKVEDGLPEIFTEVILYREDAGVFFGYFGSLEDKLADEHKGFLSEEILFEKSFFSYEYDGIHQLELEAMPTKWMPLPPNPTN